MMKMKKLLAVVLALTVALTMGIATTSVAFAADPANGTIEITPPDGVAQDAVNTYTIYKVFDATVNGEKISYKLCKGDSLTPAMEAAGFKVDAKGNVTGPEGTELSAAAIQAIAAYVTSSDIAGTATSTGSAVASTKVGPGYFYITTSTGTVVTIDSTNPVKKVNDKNTVPAVDKKITGASSVDADGKKALAQVGTKVDYSAEITIGKGAKGYVFHDTMETGLTYNSDAAVTGVDAANYTVGKDGNDTFTITFKDEYVKTLTQGTKLTITYSATVNDDAITTDPLNNTCYLSYGDKNSNNRTPDSEADVYEAKITVTKKDDAKKPLAGAGFVIKNAEGKYYSISAEKVVSWVDDVKNATEYKSNDQGEVQAFTGLADGEYTLVENTVPDGYNAAQDVTFTIAKGDYTAKNLEQGTEIINKAGGVLPSTGGIGTTIFYILGALLVIGCGIVLVARRRSAAK